MYQFALFIVLSVFLISCSHDKGQVHSEKPQAPNEKPGIKQIDAQTPTSLLPVSQWPQFLDDVDFANMILAIDRQLVRFNQKRELGSITYGGQKFPIQRVRQTLERFRELVEDTLICLATTNVIQSLCYSKLNQSIKNEFLVFQPQLIAGDPRFGQTKNTLFTAYYTPTIYADPMPSQGKSFAIYQKPSKSHQLNLSRQQIDFDKALKGLGLELAYSNDPFDLYLLHVQGGGKVSLSNGDSFYISYAGENGKKWTWISNYMLKKGYIRNKSVPAQRNYLLAHPEKHKEIFSTCPSYVFFKSSVNPPEGSDSVSLTDGRSIATDRKLYSYKGALAFVEAKRPISENSSTMKKFSRFVLDQDTGGAITGKARVDFYHGEDKYAENAAYNTKETGRIYFLILKNK